MNRLERLINLMAALLEADRALSAEEIRQLVPGYAQDQAAFRRAFERDKDALRDLGVPITVEDVDSGQPGLVGYRVTKDDYYLSDPGLAGDELAALHLAASVVSVGGASGVEALWKLGGEADDITADGQAWPPQALATIPGTAHLSPLFAAISARRTAAFAYRGRSRILEPHRLSFRNGHWYLLGRTPGDQDVRWYRLDRIDSPVEVGQTGGAFEAVPGLERHGHSPPWEIGGGEAVQALVLVDASQAGWAMGHLGPDAVEQRRSDGSVVLRVRVTNPEAFRSFVLGFLDHAEVLAPPELRHEMVDWLAMLCGQGQ